MIFIDANIFMYAAGRESQWREPCQNFLRKISQGRSRQHHCTNTEVLQEIRHRYTALNLKNVGQQIFDSILTIGIVILPITLKDMRTARALFEEHGKLSVRDAVHLGMMQEHGLTTVVSYDRDLSVVPWIERKEP